ncbi:aldo/keto reductase [Muribaculaceae bacterium Isolate-110 (HZI)]|nr:aldo/keto reductase [Muribaculaceae bacterium Isolate-110 (HZI)]
MKIKILSMIMSMFSLTACASCATTDDDPVNENPAHDPIPGLETGTNGSVLMAYFSCTGTTEGIAEGIADITGASTFRIEAEVPYTAADLDYNSDCRANREQNNPKARPAIKGMPDGLDRYDVVFIGYPIWWGEAPRIISTFLENGDFKGKTIVPFCTSHSSGLGSSDRNLHSLAPDAVWIPGRRFAENISKTELEKWISGLDIKFDTDMDYSKFPLSEGKNGQAPTIRLSSGYDMPVVGLGTYSLTGDVCVNSVKSAISLGFRKIDTAHMYGNEVEVGRGVRESGVPREEIFVATKIYPNQYGDPEAAVDECLRKLDLGYVDLMLLHHPGTDDVKAYKAMERYVKEGKIRSIGVSCYYIKEIDDFIRQVDIKPVLVQNEVHPYYQDTDVVPHIQNLGIAVEAWYPLGGRGHQKELLSDSVLTKIAMRHGKSVAQVILRWDLQRGVVVIPGSSNPDHMKENISIFDFELTEDEMTAIAALNRNEKHDWY